MAFVILSLHMLWADLAQIANIRQIAVEQIQLTGNRRFFHNVTVNIAHLRETIQLVLRLGLGKRFEDRAQRSLLQHGFGDAGIGEHHAHIQAALFG